MQNGTTYIVRPRMQPSNRPCRIAFISAGAIQLLVGPASLFAARADERAVLDAGDVARVGAGEEAVGPLLRIEPDERAGVDHLRGTGVVLLLRAVAPVHLGRLAELDGFRHPLFEPLVAYVIGNIHGKTP